MQKTVIDRIQKCYSVNALQADGQTKLLFAGEGDGSLAIYEGDSYQKKTVIWDESARLGGTMTICTVEDKEGYFFASVGFFTMIQSESSSIYLVRYRNGEYSRVKVCDIPYLHRFDVLPGDDCRYLIACTLHGGKESPEDWSKPGKILVARLPLDLDGAVSAEPEVLMDGLIQNHGFNRICENGKAAVLVAARSGVWKISPPDSGQTEFGVEQVFDFPASDVCAMDLDGDGALEYGVISPFHGNQFAVYKKAEQGPVKIYEHEKPLDFYHAIYADEFNGVPCFIIGARKLDMDLFRVYFDQKENRVDTELIETGAGSSNARIVHTPAGDLILSANRQKDEAAIFYA